MGWLHDGEVSSIERGDPPEPEAFSDSRQAGVGAAEWEVCVALDELCGPAGGGGSEADEAELPRERELGSKFVEQCPSINAATLTNSAAGGRLLGEAERSLLNELAGVGPPLAVPSTSHPLSEADAQSLVGTYSDIWTTTRVAYRDGTLTARRQIHETPMSPPLEFPPVPLHAVEPRLFTSGAGRPILFMRDEPADPTSPVTYLHQRVASRRVE